MKTISQALAILTAAVTATAAPPVFDVRDYGARPGDEVPCTAAIGRAIDACAAAGGGTVLLAGGTYVSGTIRIPSHVELRIESGTTLYGSTNLADYLPHTASIRSYADTYVQHSLILADGATNIALTGGGTIDGSGGAFPVVDKTRPYLRRPYLIRMIGCVGVRVESLRLRRSPMWMQHYLGCERVSIRDVDVWNFGNANNDALDIDGCRDVSVTSSRFESDDDAITLKSTFERPCESVTIANCIARSHCNAIKMGTESSGGFTDIAIVNCSVTRPAETNVYYGLARGHCGLALEIVDGGRMERVAIANITMRDVLVPLFIRLGDRARPFREGMPRPPVGSLRDVIIRGLVATDVGGVGCAIAGLTNAAIENLSLSDISIRFAGGGARSAVDRAVPEHPGHYPTAEMFGLLPAYGLYIRHAKDLRLSNIRVGTTSPDLRHAVVLDDVEGVSIAGLTADAFPGAAPQVLFLNVRGALIGGCRPQFPEGSFVAVSGANPRGIVLSGNDLSGVRQAVEYADGVPADAATIR